MRFIGVALVSSAVLLGACSGDKKVETTTTATTPAATAAAPAAGAAGATSTMPASPITGKTHEVKMVGDAAGYKFVPAEITVKAGDGITLTGVQFGVVARYRRRAERFEIVGLAIEPVPESYRIAALC